MWLRMMDYKTDRDTSSATLAAKYAEQVQAYERAWTRVSGASVTSEVVSTRRE